MLIRTPSFVLSVFVGDKGISLLSFTSINLIVFDLYNSSPNLLGVDERLNFYNI